MGAATDCSPPLLSPMKEKRCIPHPLEGKATPCLGQLTDPVCLQMSGRANWQKAQGVSPASPPTYLPVMESGGGGEIIGKMSAARRGGDDSGLFSPSGGGAALREPPSPGGSPAGPVVTSSLIGAGGQGSGSCGDLAGGS